MLICNHLIQSFFDVIVEPTCHFITLSAPTILVHFLISHSISFVVLSVFVLELPTHKACALFI